MTAQAHALAHKPINHWPPQLVIDMAIGVEGTETLCERYDISPLQLDRLCENPTFRAQLMEAQRVVATEGLTFKKKAAALAEMHLETMSLLIDDDLTPPATKLAAFQALCKVGGLEPKPTATDQAIGPVFNLQINL